MIENQSQFPRAKFDLQGLWQKNRIQLILAGFGVFFVLIGVLSSLAFSFRNRSSDIEILPAENEEEEVSEIFIHLAGAVEKPGLYKLPSDSRVNDALISAGGLSSDADREWFNKYINLAQKLTDGVKLYLPFKGETEKDVSANLGRMGGEDRGQSFVLGSQVQGKVNINTASVSEFDSLSGIGPAYAQRIIDYREENGAFGSIEEIINVVGIGESTFEKIKDQISVF